MYQRALALEVFVAVPASLIFPIRSARNAQQVTDAEIQARVHHKEEQHHQPDHDENEDRGEIRLFPSWPGDLVPFATYFANELDNAAALGARRCGQILARIRCRCLFCVGHLFFRYLFNWQEWRDSNPRPTVLETAALPTELHSCVHALLQDLCDDACADGTAAFADGEAQLFFH